MLGAEARGKAFPPWLCLVEGVHGWVLMFRFFLPLQIFWRWGPYWVKKQGSGWHLFCHLLHISDRQFPRQVHHLAVYVRSSGQQLQRIASLRYIFSREMSRDRSCVLLPSRRVAWFSCGGNWVFVYIYVAWSSISTPPPPSLCFLYRCFGSTGLRILTYWSNSSPSYVGLLY